MIDIDVLLAYGAVYKKVKKGEVIFAEGSTCSFYHQLVEGKVRWANIDEEGREFIQTFVEPGECFGELPLFDEGPYAATAIAEEDSILIRLHISVFHKLMAEDSKLHFAFSRLLAHRVRFKFLLLKAIAHNDPEQRISTLLNYLKKEKKNFCTKCNQLKLTRQQIADHTGLRVETTIRTLRRLSDKGMVEIINHKLYY